MNLNASSARLRAIGYAIECDRIRAAHDGGAHASREILTRVWYGRFQRIAISMAILLSHVGVTYFARQLLGRYQWFLNFVRMNRKVVEDAIDDFVRAFVAAERENRRCWISDEAAERERTAWETAEKLTEEFGQVMRSKGGWPHQIKTVEQLVPTSNGHIFNFSHPYFEGLENYLQGVVARLNH